MPVPVPVLLNSYFLLYLLHILLQLPYIAIFPERSLSLAHPLSPKSSHFFFLPHPLTPTNIFPPASPFTHVLLISPPPSLASQLLITNLSLKY